jgi:hypothetical protein
LCETRLREHLSSKGFDLRDRAILPMNGAPEHYVHASIGDTCWRLFVYLDGLEVSAGSSKALVRLEEWDARTPEELVMKARKALDRAIERGTLSHQPA